ncbi:DUF2291 family protein [Lysinibacter cavernae]|uniref:Putative lipoprotein n=1 Tax=Lysinibacter cavernae TaxID=1640652 RepID=A0A7X5TUW2_9MICO|nr:DUF2291 family protein [Lysinibacter cavernae]NIH55044.1 putative lipoprotein [Lysinibacter cavernae]
MIDTRTRSTRNTVIKRSAAVGAIVILLSLMVANTRFLSADEAVAVIPTTFVAADFAAEHYDGIVDAVTENAMPLTELAAELAAAPETAGERLGTVAGTDKYAISVDATGTVTAIDDRFITLLVDGMPDGSDVRIAIGQAINGTALRDVTGTVKFSDFPGQTDYQQVANEYRTLTVARVVDKLGPVTIGQRLSSTGVFVTNSGPAATFMLTPVSIEVAS